MPASEASCSSALQTARDIVKDVGETAARKSGGLLDLAKYQNNNNSERDARRVLVNRLKLSLPIPISFLKTGESNNTVPWFRVRDWANFIVRHNLWHMMTGLLKPDPPRSAAQWTRFWTMYRELVPNHQVFAKADRGELDLARTAAILIHGDEGRGRRRTAFMVISFHSVLGRGCQPQDRGPEPDLTSKKHYAKLLLNFKGHSYTTRYLVAAMTKKTYTHENDNVFHMVMDAIVSDLEYMSCSGVKDQQGQTFWMVPLHIVGDWPWLAKSGCFTRSFNNIQKRANANSREPPKGICHQCHAGKIDCPYEQIQTRRPIWLQTMHCDAPFSVEPPWTRLLHVPDQVTSLWAFDVFHSFHLGIGRNFVGGVLAIYSTMEPGGNVDDRFISLSTRYNNWCKQQGLSGLISRITKEVIQWPTTGHFPCAGWHKGAITTVMMKFIEDRYVNENLRNEPLLQLIGEGAVAINKCIRRMYASNVFLTPEESGFLGELAFKFLRRYSSLSAACFRDGKNLFKIMPKHHIIHKIAVQLTDARSRGAPMLNPMACSVQMDEDFIGRPSRLSRRVTPRGLTMERVLERYLQSTYKHYHDAGFLIRG